MHPHPPTAHTRAQSDCGAVKNELGGEHYAANASDAAAKAIVDGRMNSNCGGGLMEHACAAIEEGLMSRSDLVDRVTRSFTLLMDAGLFDPVELQARLLFSELGRARAFICPRPAAHCFPVSVDGHWAVFMSVGSRSRGCRFATIAHLGPTPTGPSDIHQNPV